MSVDDSYHVERVLARGIGGVTELVTLDGTGPFVRKRIPTEYARRGVWAVLPEINCRRLPHIEATYEMPDEFVVVYDYVPGETLEQLVDGQGRVSSDDARRIISQVCEAANALHEHDVVHRDITPANVIIAADGAHLIDFGISKLGEEGTSRDTRQLGTWGFAAPEQYGFAKTDARSDVYSIGQLLGYLITGVRPDDKDAFENALASLSATEPVLCQVVARATAFEPSARYQSALDLSRALREKDRPSGAEASADPAPVPPPSSTSKSSPKANHPSGLTITLIVAVAALVFAMVWFLVLPSLNKGSSSASGSSGTDQTTSRTTAQNETDTLASAAADSLSVVETYWSEPSNGTVTVIYGLENTSDTSITSPGVKVTGYAEDGSVAFSDEEILSAIGPGQTIYFSTICEDSKQLDHVDFEPFSSAGVTLLASSNPPIFSTSNVSASSDGMGGVMVSGTVTMEQDGAMDVGDYGLCLCVVLRDESGSIVGGGCDFPMTHPGLGESESFSVDILQSVEYESCEVYAYAW